MPWDDDKSAGDLIRSQDWDDQVAEIKKLMYDITTFADGDVTPSVSGGKNFKTANTTATTITQFDDGVEGQIINIIAGENNTTIASNANIKHNAGLDLLLSEFDVAKFIHNGTVWVGARYESDHGQLAGLADDDHAQYLLTLMSATQGDILFVNSVGRSDVLAAELGSGYLVLNSRGPGFDPVWLDVQELIQIITGSADVYILRFFSIVTPTFADITAVDITGAAVAESDAFAVILAVIADTTAVTSVGAVAEADAFSPALPSFGFSTLVI